MRIKLSFLLLLAASLPMFAASGLKGKLVDVSNGTPVADANLLLVDRALFTTSNANGEFEFPDADPGEDELQIIAYGYEDNNIIVHIVTGKIKDLGIIRLNPGGFELPLANSNDFIFDEEQIQDDDGMAQSVGTIQGATDDIFYQMSSYNFSTLYYRQRGLDSSWQGGYVNGVNLNDPFRGSFNFSGLGGMTSNAFRNKTTDIAMEATPYAYGSIAGNQNFTTYASGYAPGFRGNLSYTNSNYMLRAMAQYSTGVLRNGWAFSASVIGRYAPEGVIEGTWYNSFGYAVSAQKIFNDKHSLNISTWGAPTERATAAATTQEAYDLAGTNLYNPSWGYFNGKKRSARVIRSFDPTALVNWIWKPLQFTTLNTAIGFRHNAYSQTRLLYYGDNPTPDYYRKMPSYFKPTAEPGTELYDAQLSQYEMVADNWRNNIDFRQINWDAIYQGNLLNSINFDRDPEWRGQSTTVLENNHSNFTSWMFNSYIDHRFNSKMTLQAGISFNYSDAHYYKTMDDLLGGEFWRDIDTYSERDFGHSTDILQNDMRNPNRLIKDGDTFGYDYNIRNYMAKAWIQNQIVTTHWDVNYGFELSYTNFMRFGNMQNGRAPLNSYGAGERHTFDNGAIKAGATYKINGRHYFTAHASYGTRAPRSYDAYVSARIKDTAVPGLKSERFLSADLSYVWNYSRFRGSITGFWTDVWDGLKHTGFFDYDLMSFMNYSMSGIHTQFKGIEIGAEVKIIDNLSASAAASFSRYQYKNNPLGVRSYENGAEEDITRRVYLKNYYIGCTPQQAYSLALKYNIKNWFFEVNANYLADNYYDVSISRHEEMPGLWKYCTSVEEYLQRQSEITHQDRLNDAFYMNLSIGKLFYFRWGSLNFNLSVNNLTNNRNIQIRGWQDGKFDYKDYNINKYPNKVVYAQGLRVFFNVGIRF